MFFFEEVRCHIWRSKGKSLLTIMIAVLLVSFAGIYLGNISKSKIMLKKLADTVPITAQVSNVNGSMQIGLEITSRSLDELLVSGIKDAVYTSYDAANLEKINRVEPVKQCDTTVAGASSIDAFPSLKEGEIDFLDGMDGSFLEGDQPLCILKKDYAELHGITLGDTVELPLYALKYDADGYSHTLYGVGEAAIRVVGICGSAGEHAEQMTVPIRWLRAFIEQGGHDFYYDSARFTVADPLKLNAFKKRMEQNNFVEVNTKGKNSRNGDALIVQDKIFIEAAEKLKTNLRTFQTLLPPFFIMVVLLIVLVTFMLLRSRRQELAVACSLGRPKLINAAELFTETLILNVAGCLLALPILRRAVGIAVENMMLICLVFLVCVCIGVAGALMILLRFDPMALLTKID